MHKWDHLIESDVELQRLGRLVKSSQGTLQDWVRYRAFGIARGRDPLAAFLKLTGSSNRWPMYTALGIDYKHKRIDKDASAAGIVGDGYHVKVVPSTGSRGAGTRIKIQCPMCGKWISATARVVDGHLKRKDHNPEKSSER